MSKAIQYAEETLGVHAVLEESVAELEKLADVNDRLDKAHVDRRALEESYADAEVELISNKRGQHPSMSDTRFKTMLKEWERTDPTLCNIRSDLNEVRNEIQSLELQAETHRAWVRVGSARMEELGGYLHYLAAVKMAEKSTSREEK